MSPSHDADELAIAQHGDAVAQRGDLVEAMRDVDERRPVRPPRADQREQALDLGVGQRRGRLVEHDHAARRRRARGRSRSSAARRCRGRDRRVEIDRPSSPARARSISPARAARTRASSRCRIATARVRARGCRRPTCPGSARAPGARPRCRRGARRAVRAKRLDAAVDDDLALVAAAYTPPRILISVDLPAPFSPTSPSTSPGAIDERHVVQRAHARERLADRSQLDHRSRARSRAATRLAMPATRGPASANTQVARRAGPPVHAHAMPRAAPSTAPFAPAPPPLPTIGPASG